MNLHKQHYYTALNMNHNSCMYSTEFLHGTSWNINFAFSALTLLVGRQEGHPARKNWVVVTCILPSWCCYHSLFLASVKSRLVLPFWYRLAQIVPLNVCVYVCVYVCDKVKYQKQPRYLAKCGWQYGTVDKLHATKLTWNGNWQCVYDGLGVNDPSCQQTSHISTAESMPY